VITEEDRPAPVPRNDARAEPSLTGAGQLADRIGPARDRHQHRLGRAFGQSANAEREGQGGGNPADTQQRPGSGDAGGKKGRAQRGPQPLGRDDAGLSEDAPDVLVVDERLYQAGAAAQRSGLPAGLQIAGEQGQQLLGVCRSYRLSAVSLIRPGRNSAWAATPKIARAPTLS
jgi:hypothetical protein